MERKRISLGWLLLGMSLATFGLAALQWYWITGAIQLRQEQYNASVGEALSRTAKRVEQVDQTRRMLGEVPMLSDPEKLLKALSDSTWYDEPETLLTEFSEGDRGLVEDQIEHYDQPPKWRESRSVATYVSRGSNFDRREKIELKTTVGPEGVRVIRKVFQLDSLFENIVRSELIDLPLNERLEASELEKILREELSFLGSSLEFRYSVLKNHRPTGMGDPTLLPGPHTRSVRLFASDLKPRSIELLVALDDSPAKYAFKNLWGLVAIGFVLTSGVAFLFFYTLQEALNQKKLSRMKTDFINNMTHEFKTPIATINLALDAMDNPIVREQPEKLKRYAKIIREENQRMDRQVEDVLRLSMLDRRQLNLNFESIDLHDLLRAVLKRFELRLEGAKASIVWDLKASVHQLEADREQLAVVFQNLLDNALKYAQGQPLITIRTWNEPDRLCVAVGDNGRGMDHEVMSHLFDRFYRGQSGNIHTVKGHGLGLSFVKEMVHLHSGTVSVISAIGQGSTFTLQFPQQHENHT